MNMLKTKGSAVEIIILILCILGLVAYFAASVDWENTLKPMPKTPVHMNGKIAKTAPLTNVKVETIPPAVYDAMNWDHKYEKYLTGNQKWIIVISFTNQPRPHEFSQELSRLFQEKGYGEYYRKRVINLGNRYQWSCHRENCPISWLYKYCMKAVCIIQPQKRQAVIDTSLDKNQLALLLEKYKEW